METFALMTSKLKTLVLSCVSGADLDPVCSRPVLREGHHRRDSEGRGPQRPRVVRGSGATGLHAWCGVHVPSGQCPQIT